MNIAKNTLNCHNDIQLPTSVKNLQQYVNSFLEQHKKGNFSEVEKEIHTMVMEIEKEALETCLSEYDIDVPAISVSGEVYKKVVRCEKDYQSAAGVLRVSRSLYRKYSSTQTICPMELEAGIIEGHWTPAAARQGIWAVSHMTPQESEELFQEIANMTPSKSSLDRLPKKLGQLWESNFVDNQAIVRLDDKIPEEAVTVGISLDGVMVPMSKMKSSQGSNDDVVKSQYKEASCGTVSLYDAEGERLSTVQIGRMPESKKLTLKAQIKEELNNLLNQNPNLNIVKLADGAKDNWGFLEKEISEGLSLLDFWHMSEHIKEAFDAAYKDNISKSKAQFEKYKSILKNDVEGVEKLIRCLIHLRGKFPRRKVISSTLQYIRNNKHRMKYAEALEQNLPIGSGIVEASCKTLVTQRLKRSGMRWQQHGGQSILSFRALIKSSRFEKAWEHITLKYKGEIEMPENILAFPRKNNG